MALTAYRAVLVKIKISKNSRSGFSLIEVLMVLLIVGIVLSFLTYGSNIINLQQQNSLITQFQNQIQITRNKSQGFNYLMRIRLIKANDKRQIVSEYFDITQQIWRTDETIKPTIFADEKFTMDADVIKIHPNGFVTRHSVCISDECIQSAKQ